MESRKSKTNLHNIENNFNDSKKLLEKGKTELTETQRLKVNQLSILITGYPDNFFNLALSYNPKGYFNAIHSQFVLKVQDKMIEPHQQQEVLRLLGELRSEYGID